MTVQRISTAELRDLRASAPASALIDVREVEEAFRGHIPTSSSIPLRLLPFRIAGALPALDFPVIVYDAGDADTRADAAAAMLEDYGVERVLVLDGGLVRWEAAGGTVESGQNVPSKRFGEALTVDDDFHIQPETLEAWLSEGKDVQIIDVRTSAEHSRECIPGSTHAPGFSAAAAVSKDRPVIVHCSGRTRSIIGAKTLRLLGFDDVWALENGTMGWLLAGKEVERGTVRPALSEGFGGDAEIAERARQLASRVGVQALSPQAARERMLAGDGRPRYLLDVRELSELAGRTVEGARQAPSGQIIQATDDHVPVRGAGVILIDDGGARAWLSAHWLVLLGWDEVAVVEGGIGAWLRAGLPSAEHDADPDPHGLAPARTAVAEVGVDEAVALLGSGSAQVCSVDVSVAYQRGHLPGAGWLALSDVLADNPLPTLAAAATSGPVLVTCEDGRSSTLAAARLRGRGFVDVRVLAGGLAAWRAAGQPVESGRGDLPAQVEDVHPHPSTIGEDAMRGYLTWEVDLDHSEDVARIKAKLGG